MVASQLGEHAKVGSLAPLHLLLPLWGREHCDEFLALGHECLKWPGNLPALHDREVVIQTYTSHEDWEYLSQYAMFRALGRPLFFRPVPENAVRDRWTSRHQQMTMGHWLMFEAARAARAIAVPIFADSVFADGDLPRLLELLPGPPRRMVMCIGFRASHESLMAEFDARRPLSGRALVALALKHLHSQMRCWDASRPAYGSDILGGPQWHVGGSGLITHSIYWEPCAIDFSYDWPLDSQPILDWTIDGHWPWANCEVPEHYLAVIDSDDYFHLTTARETGPNAYHFEPQPMRGTLVEELRRARSLTSTDPLRQQLFHKQVLIHTQGFNEDIKGWRQASYCAHEVEKSSRVPLNEPYLFANSSPWDQDPLTEAPPAPDELGEALAVLLKHMHPPADVS
jgi:hypothetical protein